MFYLKLFLIIALCIIILFIAAYLFMVFPCLKKPKDSAKFKNTLYAHRGLHNKTAGIYENTMRAFELAVENGYGIELDVHITRDGHTVVTHDNSLKRMCGVDKKVSKCDYADFKDVKIMDTDEVTPLFSQVLECVNGKVPLLVELKTDDGNHERLCKAVLDKLDSYKGDYCIESFDPRALGYLKKVRPDIYRGQLSCHISTKSSPGYLAILLRSLGANFISRPHFVAYSYKDSKRSTGFKLCRLLGADVFYWTLRDEQTAKNALDDGGCIIFEGFDAHLFENK